MTTPESSRAARGPARHVRRSYGRSGESGISWTVRSILTRGGGLGTMHAAPDESNRSSGTTAPEPAGPSSRQAGVMLALATIGFALNFWAWALLSPLGPQL